MFEVRDVQSGLLGNRVELTALDDMKGTVKLVSFAPHGMTAYEVPYCYLRGTSLTLRFAPWKRFGRGTRVDLATVLKHPSMQRQLLREGRG